MDFRLSEGAYVVASVDHEWGAAQDGFNDFDSAHDPKLASEFSPIGVLIFWFAWYHPYSLDVLVSSVGFHFNFRGPHRFLIGTSWTTHNWELDNHAKNKANLS